MNVGSVAVHFDDMLATNQSDPQPPYLSDRNYTLVGQGDKDSGNRFMQVPQSVGQKEAPVDLVPYLDEFDIKDLSDDVAY